MDREKVIKATEYAFDVWLDEYCGCSCITEDEVQKAKEDALALLKEQEAKPLRCKECSYYRNDGWCNEHGREVKESDYCSFGAWEGR